tara:strand:- start:945 stop:1826 length:882 start_codon:yes stop_codon:yes gene_type:complete
MVVDASKKPQIVEHICKSLTQTVYCTKWIPCSARFVLMGSPPRQSGLLQIYSLQEGKLELEAEVERPKALRCGTFGATTLAQRHLTTGDFDGNYATWDLERCECGPLFQHKGHETIINCVDGVGGVRGTGAPEIATGSRDGCVHVWDPRQGETPVASMVPEVGAPVRDCWAVAFGDAQSVDSRVVAAGYDNGDVKVLDLVKGKIRWETNVANGVCGLEVRLKRQNTDQKDKHGSKRQNTDRRAQKDKDRSKRQKHRQKGGREKASERKRARESERRKRAQKARAESEHTLFSV